MSTRAWAAFVALSVIWGVPYLFIKVAVRELSPVWIAWGRMALAALVLLPLAWRQGAFRNLDGRIAAVLTFALAEVVAPFFLIAAGEQWISSSLTAILIAAIPLLVVLLAPWFVPSERPGPRRLVGIALGVIGVVALLGIDIAGRPLEALGAACVLASAVGYAVGPLVAQRSFVGLNPLGPVAVSVGIGTAVFAVPVAVRAPATLPSLSVLGSIAVLGLVCTAVALVLYLFLVAEAGAARASVITYINPAVAVLVGTAILGERPSTISVVGLLLILVGSWLATGRDRAFGRSSPSGRGPSGQNA